MFSKLILVVALVCYVVSKEVPSYIKPCKLADPKFEECVLESGNNAITSIIKGDKNYKVLNHSPLVIPEITVQSTAGLIMKLEAVHFDFEGIKLTSFKLDQEKKILSLHLLNDFFFYGNYDVNGRILLLPFSGKGPLNATMDGEDIGYTSTYELVKKGGKEYIKLLKDEVVSTNKFATYHFSNLFGGNKELGDQINKAVNENWKEFQEEFRPAIKQVWKSIVRNVLSAYLDTIPFKELFP